MKCTSNSGHIDQHIRHGIVLKVLHDVAVHAQLDLQFEWRAGSFSIFVDRRGGYERVLITLVHLEKSLICLRGGESGPILCAFQYALIQSDSDLLLEVGQHTSLVCIVMQPVCQFLINDLRI